jgi:DNA primase
VPASDFRYAARPDQRSNTLGNGYADKAAEYTRYAERCVEAVKMIPDREDRTLHREMAAEWLGLAQRLVEEATFGAQPKRRKTSQA